MSEGRKSLFVVSALLAAFLFSGCGGNCGYRHIVKHGHVYAAKCKR